mmetsp:Transcript_9641/g.14715  ORF Transcript_9641/g.14715 Transcript_9641/m.14715 type:complete len:160 (+) Transcript_9641:79-558(+)
MADDKWTNVGFSPARMGIALILLEKESNRTDTFFSYRQLEKPLNDYLAIATNDGKSGMAIVDDNLINSAFQKPRTASPYLPCSTIFEGLDEYEDYSQHYFIHIDKTNRRRRRQQIEQEHHPLGHVNPSWLILHPLIHSRRSEILSLLQTKVGMQLYCRL